MADERDQYVTEFVRESESHITALNNALLDLERSPDDRAAIEEIFRTAHTLKGNCGAMGLNEASNLAHALEDLLEAVRAGDVQVTAERMDVFFEAVDALESVIDEVAATGDPTVETDLQPTIDALRRPLDDADDGDHPAGTVPSVDPPSDQEIDAVLDPIDPPDDEDVDVYLVRLSIDEGGRDEVTNGTLVVQALIDAFDLLGTDPGRETIDDGTYGGRFDAVFASAVGESAIAAALEPVDEVGDFEIVAVTERMQEAEPDPTPDATDAASSPLGPDEDLTGDVSTDEAQEMSVDELLGEFDELDDLDALVEEVDDAGEFDDMGDAGSFHDLIDDGDEPAADTGADGQVESGEASEPAADADPTADDAADDETAESEADVPEDDASAVFQELKDEVEMVGFDELQEEIDELDFDEFDDEEEVGMDELLGDDVDPDDPAFLSVDEGDEQIGVEEPDAAEVAAVESDALESDESGSGRADEAEALAPDEAEVVDDEDADEVEIVDDEDAVEPATADGAADATDAEAESDVDESGADEADADPDVESEDAPEDAVTTDEDGLDDDSADEAIDDADEPIGDVDEATPDEPMTAAESSHEADDSDAAADSVEAEVVDDSEAFDSAADTAAAADDSGTVDEAADPVETESDSVDTVHTGSDPDEDGTDDSIAESEVEAPPEDSNGESESSADETRESTGDADASESDAFDSIDDLARESTADINEGLAESLDEELDADAGFGPDDSVADEGGFEEADSFDDDAAFADANSFDDDAAFADADSFDDEDVFGDEGAFAEDIEADAVDAVDTFEDGDAAFEYQDEGTADEFDAPSPEAADTFEDGADGFKDGADGFKDGADGFEDGADGFEEGADGFEDGADDEPSLVDLLDDVTVPDIELADRSTDDAERETRTDRSQSVRVDEDQIDQLLTLVEGLVTSRVRLRHAVDAGADLADIARELDDLEDITTELQETVMDVRLVPLRTVTNRLPRVVRDLARDQGKEVSFEQVGEEVELDRGILDRIGDPLIHLVRNAVDHGIESPDERESADKPAEGTVELRAERERNRVAITVEDDGRGLDPDRIRSEAVDADIVSEAEADSLSDEAVLDLVFHSGLSTAGEVTDVSGRGVGMDVVRRTIEDLNGSVSIESEPGEGTTVTMELPVTVAIADVLFLERDGEEFGIPIEVVDDVVDAGHVQRSDVTEAAVAGVHGGSAIGFGSDSGTDASGGDAPADEDVGPVDEDAGSGADEPPAAGSNADPAEAPGADGDDPAEELPVVDLADSLGTAGAGGEEPLDGMVIRIRDEVRPVAIHCDEVRGRQEVVVTPYEGFMGDIPGLSGATVRGRGEVVNILDVTTL